MDLRMDAKVLLRAAELVEMPGRWCQGRLGFKGTKILRASEDLVGADRVCLQGAISLASYEVHGMFHQENRLIDMMDGLGRGWRWNDHEKRTAEEVATALREAATRVERAAEGAEAPTP